MEGTPCAAQCLGERRSGVRGEALWTPVGRSGHGRSCSGALGGDKLSAQGQAFQFDPMGAMNDAVEDRVTERGVAITSCHLLTGTWLVISSEPRS